MGITEQNPLIAAIIAELEKSLELAATLSSGVYCTQADGAGSIGAHIRHDLDFVAALLRGVSVGSIDYADRERDPRIETDQRYARTKIEEAIGLLKECSKIDPASLLIIRSEVRPDMRHRSSYSRELEFVYSHTVHHHALIGDRLRSLGIKVKDEFGLAASTKKYRNGLKAAA